jgi:hypothetical protein
MSLTASEYKAGTVKKKIVSKKKKKKQSYPSSILHSRNSTTETYPVSKSCVGKLLHCQFYSSIKKVFAAENVYSFTRVATETLALNLDAFATSFAHTTTPGILAKNLWILHLSNLS